MKFTHRELTRGIVRAYLRYFHQFKAQGMDNVPRRGPFVLISNHGSFFDPLAIRCVLRRTVWFMTWTKVLSWPVVGRLVRYASTFSVNLEKGHDLGAFREALSLLARGEGVGIFPEGRRAPGPFMEDGKLGAIQIAYRSGAPIIPVSLVGVHDVWPRGQRLPRSGRIGIIFHPPIPMPQRSFGSRHEERESLTKMMTQVQQVINSGVAARLRAWIAEGCVGRSAERFRLIEAKSGAILQREKSVITGRV